jgi:hypothetical protein
MPPELSTLAEFIAQATAPFEKRGALSRLNKRMTARTTVADGDRACDVAMAATPAASISVLVNGVAVPELGDGTKAGAVCYFSATAGVTARAWSAVQLGDVLYWQGSIAGYQLGPSDVIDFLYEEG